MLSDISDLTDISSDEEDILPLRKTRSKAKKPEYQITQSLRPPRTSQYTAKALYDNIVENTIDLDPEYQRDVVWPDAKQIGLIDSLLHNYYIPPIIFAVSATDEGYEKRTCIDGKQRLTSIQRFMDGLIPHKDSFTNQKMWYSIDGHSGRKPLPPQYKKIFSNKQIVCMEYEGLTGDQEREIFQRVQLGVALTPAERMQAISGPWPSLIREVLSQVLGEDGFDGYLEWGRGRGRDFQCLTSIAYIMEKFPKHTNPTVTQLEKWLQDSRPVPTKFRDSLFDTFRIFVVLARDKKCFQSPTRVSPVEFVMIGLLIHVYSATFSFTQLSSAIGKLRADVRANFIDIRMNTKTMKHMFNFVTKSIKASDFKDGKGDPPAAFKGKAAPAKPPKRKRITPDSDDDAEGSVKPPPPTKTKTTAGSSSKGSKTSANQSKPSKLLALPLPKPAAVPKPPRPSKMETSKSPPIPTLPVTPRVPRISTVASAASKPGPSSAISPPMPAIPSRQVPPPSVFPATPSITAPARPKISPPRIPPPTPASKISPPRIPSLPSVNHLVSVKNEPQLSPPPPSAQRSSDDHREGPHNTEQEPVVASTFPDRLAPLRAAKAAVKHDTVAPTMSPSSGFSVAAALQGGETSETAHDARLPLHATPQLPAPEATTFPPDLELNQANLDAMLRRAGYPTQQPQPVGPPSAPAPPIVEPQQSAGYLPNGVSDMSISPPMQHGELSVQPQAPRATQDTLPVKPLLSNSDSCSRRASGGSGQGRLLATPMARGGEVTAANQSPPQRPAAAAAPPPPSSASSSSSAHPSHMSPAHSTYYDRRDYPDRRTESSERSRRGSSDMPRGPRGYRDTDYDRPKGRERDWDRYGDRDTGYRRGSWEVREWERTDRGWGYHPGGRHRK